jgi:hypothetical protein
MTLRPYEYEDIARGDPAALYLTHVTSLKTRAKWTASVQFLLMMSNSQDPSVYLTCCWCPDEFWAASRLIPTFADRKSRYDPDNTNWGAKSWTVYRKLTEPSGGRRPIVEDNRVELTAFVRVLAEPVTTLPQEQGPSE